MAESDDLLPQVRLLVEALDYSYGSGRFPLFDPVDELTYTFARGFEDAPGEADILWRREGDFTDRPDYEASVVAMALASISDNEDRFSLRDALRVYRNWRDGVYL